MIYDYKCCKCGKEWEAIRPIADRDAPFIEACECGYSGRQIRKVATKMTIDFNGKHTMLQRAGWGWNDVQKRIKKGSGKENTINIR